MNIDELFQIADSKLSGLLGVAGATVGIIMATEIIMGMIVGRYIGIFDRYRAFTGEQRASGDNDQLRGHLQKEVVLYRRQLGRTLAVTVPPPQNL